MEIESRESTEIERSKTAFLTWENVSLRLNNLHDTNILYELSGYAEPGVITAIMGPSGCGKSALLDCLAGRLSKNVTITGDIRLNGQKQEISHGTAAYLPQEYDLLGTLTVSETIYYSAKLRLPSSTSKSDLTRIVKRAIEEVGLKDVMDTPIGNWHKRGLSCGERRRVSIAIALLTRPRLLFLDEPTSGLDSASAFHVVSTLRRLALDGRTVLCSIHQPSSEVFHLFHHLCLLSSGKQVYFGELEGALKFFANNGHPCPALQNPASHYLHCINSDFDTVNQSLKNSYSLRRTIPELEEGVLLPTQSVAQIVKGLTDAYALSDDKATVVQSIQEITRKALTLTMRSFVNMHRDFGYFWLRLLMYIVMSTAMGTIYFDVGFSYRAIQARVACISFVVAFLTFMAVGGFPSFVEDMKVFTMERLNGHYGVAAFVVGNTLSSIPFLFMVALVSTVIVYTLANLHQGAEFFFYFVLCLFATLFVVESLMMSVASMVPNFMLGIIVAACVQGSFILVAGSFRLPDDLPAPVWKYPMFYIAFHMYALQGMLENDFTGLTFENINGPSFPRVGSDHILRELYNVTVSRGKWWNLAVLVLMSVLYRLTFYILLRFNETLLPSLRIWLSQRRRKLRLCGCDQ